MLSCQTCPPAAEILPPKATATKAPAAAGAPGATAPAAHGRRGSAPGGRNPLGVQLWQLWFKIGIPPTKHCPPLPLKSCIN
jgi:hypothetical protein